MQVGDMMDIAVEQIRLKIIEDYPNVNVDEIAFAFRNYGTTIEDWGKMFNLNLFDKVMSKYLADRYETSNIEERLRENPEQIIYTKEQLLNFARKDANDFYDRILNCRFSEPSSAVIEVLKLDFGLKDEQINDFIVKAVNSKTPFYQVEK